MLGVMELSGFGSGLGAPPGSLMVETTRSFTVGIDCPRFVRYLTFWVRGAGGNGGSINTTTGCGGGGGAFAKVRIRTWPGDVLTLTVGAPGQITKIERGATVLVECNSGGHGTADGAVGLGGTFTVDSSVELLDSANGVNGTPGVGGASNPAGHGGEGGGAGGYSYGQGGNGGNGGIFGRGGNAGGTTPGTPGTTGVNSPGYPGGVNGTSGVGATGLMKAEW